MKSNDRDVDLNKLETFFAVAAEGGVTPAARRLALTRSAVSHSLTSLEESLGTPLFHRVGRGLVLTPEGAELQRSFGDARERLLASLDPLTRTDAEVRGVVRVGLFLGFSRFRLAGVLERFARDHPLARVRVGYGSQAELVEQLEGGRVDFTLSLRPKRQLSRKLRSSRLFEQELVLASATPPRPRRPGPDALAALPIVDYYRSDPLVDRWARHHHGRPLPRRDVRVWGATTDLVLELVLAGVGVGVLPRDVVEPFRRRRELHVIPGPGEPLGDAVWLNELRGAQLRGAPKAFRAALLESARVRR